MAVKKKKNSKKTVAAKKKAPASSSKSRKKKSSPKPVKKSSRVAVVTKKKPLPAKKKISVPEKKTAPVAKTKTKVESKPSRLPVEKKTAEEKEIKKSGASKKEAKIAPPVVELKPIIVSSFPKLKVKTVLVSQPKPDNDKNPYLELARKHNLKMNFRQFISIEGVPAKEFRAQRVNILDHNAVILTSRIAIDHYFRMANEMRITIPETMKYFCLSESIAYYLQKYVQYRKRKIFFGHQTIEDLVDVLKKHKEEKFLLPVSDVHREKIVEFLDEMNVKYTKATFYKTVSADLSDMNGVLDYDIVVFFTPAGIHSLKKNFPNLKQGNLRIAAFGYNTAQTVQELGYRLDIHSPTPQAPSMTMALDQYIREANKR